MYEFINNISVLINSQRFIIFYSELSQSNAQFMLNIDYRMDEMAPYIRYSAECVINAVPQHTRNVVPMISILFVRALNVVRNLIR